MTSLRAQFTRELTIRGRAARTIQGYRPRSKAKADSVWCAFRGIDN